MVLRSKSGRERKQLNKKSRKRDKRFQENDEQKKGKTNKFDTHCLPVEDGHIY